MKPIDSTLFHRIIPPRRSSAAPHPALLLLHGRGADEEDLLGLTPFLDERLLFLAARAPYPFSFGGYTWFDAGPAGDPEPEMFRKSYEALHAFVRDALSSYPIDPGQLYLFGFSMGTVMSYALALSLPELVRGVLANSGYVPEETTLQFRWRDLAKTDFCITHGILDPVIPVEAARRAKQLFQQSNAAVWYREYPMAHEIGRESLDAGASWLRERIETRT